MPGIRNRNCQRMWSVGCPRPRLLTPGVDIHRVLTPGVDIQYRSSESARGLGLVTTWPRTLAHDVRRVEAAHAAPRGVPPPAWAGQGRTVWHSVTLGDALV